MSKKVFTIILVGLFAVIFPLSAHSEGIPLQKDILLATPIFGPEDLPEEITFTLYDAHDAITPLGSQTFQRGQYTVDFEFSQSDGVTGGNAARIKANFTKILNLVDAFGQPLKPRELWAALEVTGAEIGPRTKVSEETMVQLLLNSDASMATYLTLAYAGDDNPLTTIYKTLPLSSLFPDGSTTSLSSYFSAVAAGSADKTFGALTDPNNWYPSGNDIYYTNGKVGIGTDSPLAALHISSDNGTSLHITRRGDGQSVLYWENDYKRWVFGQKSNAQGNNFFIQSRNTDNSDVRTVLEIASGAPHRALYIDPNGNVGFGTTKLSGYKLAIAGKIRAEELRVDTGWADFVFDPSYKLPSLGEVEHYIQNNRHLPGIPTEAEVKENGVSVGEMSSKLLQKIEELTLYVIDMNKENESLKAQLANLEAQMKEIKN